MMPVKNSLKIALLLLPVVLSLSCKTPVVEDTPEYFPDPDNLLSNASFEDGISDWESHWSRVSGKLKVSITSSIVFEGSSALYVKHSGSRDWSVSSNKHIAVTPGEVYELGGIIKCNDMSGRVELSVVTRGPDDDVLDWLYSKVQVSTKGDWNSLSSRFIVPNECRSIQFRITGNGITDAYIDNVYLKKIRNAPEAFVSEDPVISIETAGTSISFDTTRDLFSMQFNKSRKVYALEGLTSDGVVTDIKTTGNTLIAEITAINDSPISLEFHVLDDGNIRCSISGDGPLVNPFTAPGIILAENDQSWVIPQNEGLLIPSNDTNYRPWTLDLAQGHGGLSMPFIGLTDGTEGLMVLSLTPDDNTASFRRPNPEKGILSGFGFSWRPQMGSWGYSRILEYRFIPEGGYVGIAKAYREIAKEQGKLVTLKEKLKTVPQLDRLIGAANVWWWEKAEWWSNDPDAGKAAARLHSDGMDKVLWSHDADPATIKTLNSLGYVSGKYDIYQDVWAPEVPISYGNRKGWPEDLVLLPDGSPMSGWVTKVNGKEYPGGVICSSRGYRRMKKEVPEELATHPYLARFIDTTTASPLRECYNPDHPLSRSEDREYKSKMLGFLSGELNLITGSETGIDWAVPNVHYFEGMMSLGPYRFDDAGYDLSTYKKPTEEMLRFQVGPYYRIPLFELVYHDCVVSYWYWGDSSNRNPELMRDRDLFNVLYGTGPLYILDPDRWDKSKDEIIESYRTATLTSRNCGYEELVEHRFLNDDHTLQYSRFSDGTEVWVNFSIDNIVFLNNLEIGSKEYFVSKKTTKQLDSH